MKSRKETSHWNFGQGTHLGGVNLLEGLEDVDDPGLDVGLGEACRGGVEADGCEARGDDGGTGDGACEGHRSTSSDERGGSGSESGNHCDRRCGYVTR